MFHNRLNIFFVQKMFFSFFFATKTFFLNIVLMKPQKRYCLCRHSFSRTFDNSLIISKANSSVFLSLSLALSLLSLFTLSFFLSLSRVILSLQTPTTSLSPFLSLFPLPLSLFFLFLRRFQNFHSLIAAPKPVGNSDDENWMRERGEIEGRGGESKTGSWYYILLRETETEGKWERRERERERERNKNKEWQVKNLIVRNKRTDRF